MAALLPATIFFLIAVAAKHATAYSMERAGESAVNAHYLGSAEILTAVHEVAKFVTKFLLIIAVVVTIIEFIW